MPTVLLSEETKTEVIHRTSIAINTLMSFKTAANIIHTLNENIKSKKEGKPFMYDGKFSKYRNEVLHEVSKRTGVNMLQVLERILHDEYKLKWDRAAKSYIPLDGYVFDESKAIKRMAGLQGTWTGYSYARYPFH